MTTAEDDDSDRELQPIEPELFERQVCDRCVFHSGCDKKCSAASKGICLSFIKRKPK